MDKRVYIQIKRNDGKEFHIDGSDWKIPSNGLDGFGSFENDITTVDNAVGDGGTDVSSRIAPKDRFITAKSVNPAMNEILRRVALSFFGSKYTYLVYMTYMGETRWFEGKLHKFDISTGNIHKPMVITMVFHCADPFLRSYDNFGRNIASIMGMLGFPYLCGITAGAPKGVTGGRYNFAQKVFLNNDGNVETFCQAVFTAKGEVVNPKLVINGNYVRIIDTMVKGDVIIIDFTKKPPIVKKNGVNCVGKCDKTSAFDDMALSIGTSEVSFDADTGNNLLDVSIYYNKLYEAI